METKFYLMEKETHSELDLRAKKTECEKLFGEKKNDRHLCRTNYCSPVVLMRKIQRDLDKRKCEDFEKIKGIL